jgi:hypothetical protein
VTNLYIGNISVTYRHKAVTWNVFGLIDGLSWYSNPRLWTPSVLVPEFSSVWPPACRDLTLQDLASHIVPQMNKKKFFRFLWAVFWPQFRNWRMNTVCSPIFCSLEDRTVLPTVNVTLFLLHMFTCIYVLMYERKYWPPVWGIKRQMCVGKRRVQS